jgi:hypothetical protein
MEQVTDSRWELRANREHSQRELRVNSNSLNQSRLQYLTEMGEVTTSQSSSPQGTQQNVVPFTEKKMSMPTFCSYFEGHLPQPFQVEEASNRTQEKLREGDVLVGCLVKKTQVMRARLPKSEKTVTIPKNSAISFVLLPNDGDEGGQLGQKWEGTFNVSELIRVEPLPPAAKVMVDCKDCKKKKVPMGTILFNLTTFSTKGMIQKKKVIKGVSSRGVTYRFTEGVDVNFSTKQLDTRCNLAEIYDIFEGPVRARVFCKGGKDLKQNDLVVFEEKGEENFLVATTLEGEGRSKRVISIPVNHSIQVLPVTIEGYHPEVLVGQKVSLRKKSSTNILQDMENHVYVDDPVNPDVRDEPDPTVIYEDLHFYDDDKRRISTESTVTARSVSTENLVSDGYMEMGERQRQPTELEERIYKNLAQLRPSLTSYMDVRGTRRVSDTIRQALYVNARPTPRLGRSLSTSYDYVPFTRSGEDTLPFRASTVNDPSLIAEELLYRSSQSRPPSVDEDPYDYPENAVRQTQPEVIHLEKISEEEESRDRPEEESTKPPVGSPPEPPKVRPKPSKVHLSSPVRKEPLTTPPHPTSSPTVRRAIHPNMPHLTQADLNSSKVLKEATSHEEQSGSRSRTERFSLQHHPLESPPVPQRRQTCSIKLPTSFGRVSPHTHPPPESLERDSPHKRAPPPVKPKTFKPFTDENFQARPTPLQLMHHVAGRVGEKWRTLGTYLGLEEPYLDEAKHKGNTLREVCYQSLLLWLQGEGKDPKSWSVVLNALKKSGFIAVAMEIERHIRAGTLDSDEL